MMTSQVRRPRKSRINPLFCRPPPRRDCQDFHQQVPAQPVQAPLPSEKRRDSLYRRDNTLRIEEGAIKVPRVSGTYKDYGRNTDVWSDAFLNYFHDYGVFLWSHSSRSPRRPGQLFPPDRRAEYHLQVARRCPLTCNRSPHAHRFPAAHQPY